jgi:hypothetical protein
MFYELADIESKTNDNAQDVWAWYRAREKHTSALNNKLWYSRQIYMLLVINNREYGKGIQDYKQLSH